MSYLVLLVAIALLLSCETYAKEPTILFLGPNGVRPLNTYNQNQYGSGSSMSGNGNGGGMFSAFPSALSSALNSFRDRDRDAEPSSSNFIFRLGERFQERAAKQKGPRIIVIPPLNSPKPRYASAPYGTPQYGGQYHGASSNHHYQHAYSPYSRHSYNPYMTTYPGVAQSVYGGYGY